jgi:hypothetical protein
MFALFASNAMPPARRVGLSILNLPASRSVQSSDYQPTHLTHEIISLTTAGIAIAIRVLIVARFLVCSNLICSI